MAQTEVAKREALAVSKFDYGADANAGFEGQTSDEMQIPFLALLQALSPQVSGAKKVKGAEAGALFNTVTESLLGSEVLFVPALREHVFVEWKPRKAGGGFVARHERESEVVRAAIEAAKEFGKYTTPAGNDLVETYYLYGMVVSGTDLEPIVVAFSSTKIKVFKKWNTQVHMFTVEVNGKKQRPPRFAHLLKIKTTPQTNAKGTFYNFVIEPANGSIKGSLLEPGDPRLQAAKALGEMVAAGKARAAYETQEVGGSEAEEAF